jgi:hypothetical protein
MDISELAGFHKLAFSALYVFFIQNRRQDTCSHQRDIIAILMAWWITFTLMITILMTMGFGPRGILTG